MEGTELVIWIADLMRDPVGRDALRDGNMLTETARREGRIVVQGQGAADQFGRKFAEAYEDGWLDFDYAVWPNDPEPPPKFRFQHHHLQRCQNIRIARDAWPSIPALRAELAPSTATPGASSADAPVEAIGAPERDIFICHAGEDKDLVARPLAEQLRERGCRDVTWPTASQRI